METKGIYLTDATLSALAAERAADVRSINDTLAELAIAELRLKEAREALANIRAMIAGRVTYDEPCTRIEVYEVLLDEIMLTAKAVEQ